MTKKADLIDMVEDWLIRWDFKDSYCRLSTSQIRKIEINSYLHGTIAYPKSYKDEIALQNLCQMIESNFCRGIDKRLKKQIKEYAQMSK